MEKKKGSILIVDDNEISLRILKYFLSKQGYKVHSTLDPEEGLAVLPALTVDLCIFDHCMPDMNGFELCKKIKKKRPEMPVIIYTGSILLSDRFAAKVAGADAFILKEGMMDGLAESVKVLLNKNSQINITE